jgi:alpha,alpha-trehalose phosphorylase
MVAVYGFAGMRDYNGKISFRPNVPPPIDRLRFPLIIREQKLVVDIQGDTATYLLREGAGITIHHEDREVRLTKGEPVSLPILGNGKE